MERLVDFISVVVEFFIVGIACAILSASACAEKEMKCHDQAAVGR